MWWSPGPRMVLYPDKLKVSKSLAQSIRNKGFSVAFDTNFARVIAQCAAAPRHDQDGTWITAEMQEAYIDLHNEGFAHSVEIYHQKTLVGGLYGVSLGRVFFGESMFHQQRDASKVALYYLVEKLMAWDFDLIDAQQNTGHIQSMGGELVEKSVFLDILKKSLKAPTIRGKWSL
jgi:leucyl/phenylalanyl-tRNA--protein transferase